MTDYATQFDFEQRFGSELINRLSDVNDDGTPNEQPIIDAISSASSIIDANLAARYPVPLEDVPSVVKDLCLDIALYRLAINTLKATDEMRLRYTDAIALLQRVAEGKASIGLDTDGDGVSDDQVSTAGTSSGVLGTVGVAFLDRS